MFVDVPVHTVGPDIDMDIIGVVLVVAPKFVLFILSPTDLHLFSASSRVDLCEMYLLWT